MYTVVATPTVYLGDEQEAYLRGMIEDDGDPVENMSQAVQYCVRKQQQREVDNDN